MLRRASRDFVRTVDQVTLGNLAQPTPCPGWDVRELLRHVIGGDEAYVALLRGGDAEDFHAVMSAYTLSTDDIGTVARDSATRLIGEFSAPGVLDGTVQHPVGEIPVRRLLGMRVTEWLIHGWDVARAIGAEARLDPEVAESLYAELSQRAEGLVASGYFANGSGVAEDADPQTRLLDLLGRSAR